MLPWSSDRRSHPVRGPRHAAERAISDTARRMARPVRRACRCGYPEPGGLRNRSCHRT
ncbi:hypothetical protein TUM17568_57410 [Klebsiella oxytoca]|nr:hypothetical protein TUM17568_57410 [Klebsiella oxytoca]